MAVRFLSSETVNGSVTITSAGSASFNITNTNVSGTTQQWGQYVGSNADYVFRDFTDSRSPLILHGDGNATFAGNVSITNASTPLLTITDTTNNVILLQGTDDTNAFIRSYVGPLLLQTNGGSTALTLDSTQNATFAGKIFIPQSPGHLQGNGYPGTTYIGSTTNATTTYIQAGSTAKTEIELSGGDVNSNILFKTPNSSNTTVTAMTIDTNQRVGIGVTPATKLDIGGMADPVLRIKSDAGGDPELRFDAAATNRSARIKFYDNGSVVGGFIDYLHNGDKMNFGAGSSSGVTMTVGDGAVGIGTDSPSAKLEIVTAVGADAIRMNYGQSADIFLGFSSANPRMLLQDNSNVVTHNFVSNGDNYIVGSNVGIGTTSPGNKLNVVEGTSTWETVEIQSSSTTGCGLTLVGADTSVQWSLIAQGTTGGAGSNNLGFHLTGAGSSGGSTGYKMTIQASSGNVGIGTTSPFKTLDVRQRNK